MVPARVLLSAMTLAIAAGCAAVIGADFDRELATGGDAEAGDVGPADGAVVIDGQAKDAPAPLLGDGGIETFFTVALTDRVADVYTSGNDVFWTTLDGYGAFPTHVTLHARRTDGTNDRVIGTTPTSGNAYGIGRCFSLAGAGTTVWLANTADQSGGSILSTAGTGLVDQVINEDAPCVLAIVQGRPFWWHATSSLLRTSTTSGGAKTVSEAFLAEHVVSDATSLFADSIAYFDVAGAHRAVLRLDVSGSGEVTVVPLVVDAVGLLGGLTLSPTHVFWSDTVAGSVLSVPKAGGTPVVVASGLGRPRYVAYRDSWLFLSTDATDGRDVGTVARIRVAAGNPVGAIQPIATKIDLPRQLAIDATHLYWIGAGQRIMRRRVDAD